MSNKYMRVIGHPDLKFYVDVYDVIEAFKVTCPARQHAIKKLLCAGIRGVKSQLDDLNEARQSIERAYEMQVARESVISKPACS